MQEPAPVARGDRGLPIAAGLRTRGPHPWRLSEASALAETLVFERSLFDEAGRAAGRERVSVDLAGSGPRPALRLGLAVWVLLGKLAPADLDAIARELRAAGGAGAGRLEDALRALGPGAREALDDPMGGVLTGPLQRALAGPGTTLVEALEHVTAGPEPRHALAYAGTFTRTRRAIVALAFRLARELPPFPAEVLDGSVELFGWWRESGSREVPLDAGGAPVAVRIPSGLSRLAERGASATLAGLLGSIRSTAERLGHPRRDFSGVARDVSTELLDGLASLLLNGLCLDRAPSPGDVVSSLGPAGYLPTRARQARSVTVSGAPFHDALGRFFAVPSRRLDLPRTGRSVSVRLTGTCPFPLVGRSPAGDGTES